MRIFLLSLILACFAFHIRNYVFNLTQVYVAQDGVYKSRIAVNGISPGPLIEGDEGDRIRVTVINFLQVRAAIHFHGILQIGTPWADGVPGLTQYPIPSGGSYNYTFQLLNQSGSTWYHSHFRGYLSDGLYGAIYIRPSPERQRPYGLITNTPQDLEELHALEKNPNHLIADDTFKHQMDDVIARMFHFGVDPVCIQSILVNGKGRIFCHSHERFYHLAKKNKYLRKIPHFDSMGCLRDDSIFEYQDESLDHFALELPGYSPGCSPTLSDNFIYFTNGSNWQYVNIINAGGQYTKGFSIDDHEIYVVAVDGIFIHPQRATSIMLPVGTRMTVCFETRKEQHENVHKPFAIRFAAVHTPQFIEGKAFLLYGSPSDFDEDEIRVTQERNEIDNGIKFQDLDGYPLTKSFNCLWPHHTRPYEDSAALKHTGPGDVTFNFYLNRTGMVDFSMFEDKTQLPHDFEIREPLLLSCAKKDLVATHRSKAFLQPPVKTGQVVDFIINNYKHINHPIHLHGHFVHLISYSDKVNFPYHTVEDAIANNYPNLNLVDPPLTDVVMVAVGGHVVLRIVANNPGVWLLHCHNIGHLLGGMGAVLFEGLEELPSLLEDYRKSTEPR